MWLPRVKDMEIRRIAGVVSDHISLKKAWNLMRTQNVNTLPIVQEGNMLEGLITISDIAKSYMDVYDNAILSTATHSVQKYSGDAGRNYGGGK